MFLLKKVTLLSNVHAHLVSVKKKKHGKDFPLVINSTRLVNAC